MISFERIVAKKRRRKTSSRISPQSLASGERVGLLTPEFVFVWSIRVYRSVIVGVGLPQIVEWLVLFGGDVCFGHMRFMACSCLTTEKCWWSKAGQRWICWRTMYIYAKTHTCTVIYLWYVARLFLNSAWGLGVVEASAWHGAVVVTVDETGKSRQ